MVYKGFNIPDEVVDDYVDRLGCSIAEACDAYLCDNDKSVNAEQEQLTKQANVAGVGKMVGAAKGSRPNRGKKAPNEDKKCIIRELFGAISLISDVVEVKNDEKYIDFEYNGENYTINLVKHRKKE